MRASTVWLGELRELGIPVEVDEEKVEGCGPCSRSETRDSREETNT